MPKIRRRARVWPALARAKPQAWRSGEGDGRFGFFGTPIHILLTPRGLGLRLRFHDLADAALGPQPDFEGVRFEVAVLRLAGVEAHRHRLIADVLDLSMALTSVRARQAAS
jgi:hypothetical protein